MLLNLQYLCNKQGEEREKNVREERIEEREENRGERGGGDGRRTIQCLVE